MAARVTHRVSCKSRLRHARHRDVHPEVLLVFTTFLLARRPDDAPRLQCSRPHASVFLEKTKSPLVCLLQGYKIFVYPYTLTSRHKRRTCTHAISSPGPRPVAPHPCRRARRLVPRTPGRCPLVSRPPSSRLASASPSRRPRLRSTLAVQ